MPSSIQASRRTSTPEHMKGRTEESLSGSTADVQTQIIPSQPARHRRSASWMASAKSAGRGPFSSVRMFRCRCSSLPVPTMHVDTPGACAAKRRATSLQSNPARRVPGAASGASTAWPDGAPHQLEFTACHRGVDAAARCTTASREGRRRANPLACFPSRPAPSAWLDFGSSRVFGAIGNSSQLALDSWLAPHLYRLVRAVAPGSN